MPVENNKFLKFFYKKKTILIVFFLFLLILISGSVLAQRLEVNYPEVFGERPETIQTPLSTYVKYLFNFAIAIVGIIALIALTWGGFLYFFSAGNVNRLKEGKERIKSAGLGLTILVLSYLILITINPELVILNFGPLTPVEPGDIVIYNAPETEVTLIVAELPLKRLLKEGSVWEEERTEELEDLIIEFEDFLKEEINMNDSNLENDDFYRISDLNKYLKTVTDECRCENAKALCTKPQSGSMPIGCTGDPCENDHGGPSPRERIEDILAIDKDKIDDLKEYEEEISEHEDLLREEIREFQRVEGEIISCRTQNREFMTLNELLLLKQQFEELGNQVLEISGYEEKGDDALTFYCPVGGTIYDTPYLPQKLEELSDEIVVSSPYEVQLISCHTRIPTGETIDQLRELAVTAAFKLEKLSSLTKQMVQQVQEMTELVSQCNRTYCDPSCACIPNPCYLCCTPVPCGPCVPFCQSRCLQAVGGCNGEACPTEDITEKSEEIKATEDEIFETIREIKDIFPDVPYHTEDPENTYNLKNLDTATRLCFDPDINNPKSILLSCEEAKGNYGPDGGIMTNCHPRDLYCCTPSNTPPLLISPDSDPIYIVPLREHSVLASENGCPKGYDCTASVRDYDQYKNDASKPLKQLLSCMRQGLDMLEYSEELEEIIGLISSISDKKLYTGTCEWDVSPAKPGGCSHTYEIERGKRKVSAHYGGTFCRDTEESYAVDFDMSSNFQKKYIDEIINLARKCAPEAYILDKTTYLHIDIGELYDCETSDF